MLERISVHIAQFILFVELCEHTRIRLTQTRTPQIQIVDRLFLSIGLLSLDSGQIALLIFQNFRLMRVHPLCVHRVGGV